MSDNLKKYPTIGSCGIDCGLCPRFQSENKSACPGCGGSQFKTKHPSCGFLSCCAIKHNLEVCSQCNEFPCARFNSETEGYDSFVTHKKIFPNLEYIKINGIEGFLETQETRISILKYFLSDFDDGRSKSHFCLSCALLPVEELVNIQKSMIGMADTIDRKEKNKLLKEKLLEAAGNNNIILDLNRKKN